MMFSLVWSMLDQSGVRFELSQDRVPPDCGRILRLLGVVAIRKSISPKHDFSKCQNPKSEKSFRSIDPDRTTFRFEPLRTSAAENIRFPKPDRLRVARVGAAFPSYLAIPCHCWLLTLWHTRPTPGYSPEASSSEPKGKAVTRVKPTYARETAAVGASPGAAPK